MASRVGTAEDVFGDERDVLCERDELDEYEPLVRRDVGPVRLIAESGAYIERPTLGEALEFAFQPRISPFIITKVVLL